MTPVSRSKTQALEDRARHRAQVIMKVRCGLINAREAAAELGVSRKTYYKWEERGLAGLLDSVQEQAGGRPAQPEVNGESLLERKLVDLQRENKLLRQKLELKDLLNQLDAGSGKDRAEKKRTDRTGR